MARRLAASFRKEIGNITKPCEAEFHTVFEIGYAVADVVSRLYEVCQWMPIPYSIRITRYACALTYSFEDRSFCFEIPEFVFASPFRILRRPRIFVKRA